MSASETKVRERVERELTSELAKQIQLVEKMEDQVRYWKDKVKRYSE
jgi:uncharacterized coiled-coil protein SlyX